MSSCGTETGHVAALVFSEELQDTSAGTDRSPDQVISTDIEVTVPETNSAVTEKPALQHVVDEEAILQLMQNCPMCNRKCRCTKRICGPYLIVYQSCYFCHYQRKWASQPEAANISSYKTPTPAKRKPQPKDKVSVSTKVQTSLLDQTLET